MRGVVYAGLALVGVAALSGVTQQAFHDLPWTGAGSTATTSRSSRPPAVRHLHAAAAARRRDRDGDGRCSPCDARLVRRRPAERHRAVPVRLLRARDDPRRHARRRAVPDRRPRAAGHGVRGGDARLRRLRRRAGRPRRDRLVAARSGRAARCRRCRRWASPCSASLATVLASLPYFVAGFADQPASSGTYDYSGPSGCGTSLVTIGHAPDGARRAWPSPASSLRPAAIGRRGAGDDPWGAQTLEWTTTSPAPIDNFAEVPTVMSPEPALDLRGPDGADR